MRHRTVASLTIFCLGTLLAASAQSEKETDPMNPARARAKTKITVQSSEAKPYETTIPTLVEIYISEKFLGDIDGESLVRALQVQRDDKFASMVVLERHNELDRLVSIPDCDVQRRTFQVGLGDRGRYAVSVGSARISPP